MSTTMNTRNTGGRSFCVRETGWHFPPFFRTHKDRPPVFLGSQLFFLEIRFLLWYIIIRRKQYRCCRENRLRRK